MSDEEEQGFPVKVYVYDISRGMAAMYAPMILGINLEAIYHTSVVIYGKEYYIDQGIKCATPGTTKYGVPIEVLDLGETYVTEDIFDEFMNELKDEFKYSAIAYDLFDNNCNHFTDKVVEFSSGKNLEDRILKLPQQVLNTPNGQYLRQMLGGQIA
ncbi:hypothetical protein CAAN1_12S01596 [[Candida] anglica]|uniref:PPPDE domain-containing protein n=1 Tax=[Candida] anglica TaxID=148631 RepID=A0ABP0E762_9ASCO